jgi:hypothetical protein
MASLLLKACHSTASIQEPLNSLLIIVARIKLKTSVAFCPNPCTLLFRYFIDPIMALHPTLCIMRDQYKGWQPLFKTINPEDGNRKYCRNKEKLPTFYQMCCRKPKPFICSFANVRARGISKFKLQALKAKAGGDMGSMEFQTHQQLNVNAVFPTNEELRDLYSSPSIIRIIKSRRMRWTGHVARMGEKRNAYRLLVGKPEGKRLL